MSQYSDEIWALITRVLSGEATPLEEKKLRQWLDEDPKHKEFFENIKSSWSADPGKLSETFLFDYQSGLGKLRNKLDKERSRSVLKAVPKKNKALKHTWAMAAAILMVLSLSVFGTLYLWDSTGSAMSSYATSDVEQRIITLADGSVVRLNRDSKIDVMYDPDTPVREVYLEGEAFFDVAGDPDRPFVIYMEDAVVEVLGTSFNIKEGEEVMVAVRDGKVALRHREHEDKSAAHLTAGQIGLLSKTGRDVKIEEANIENYLSWMNGYLRFESMPFGQVIRQLERIYGMEHELDDPNIGSIQLTVYTEQMQEEEVLNTIALALDLTYELQEGVIHWRRDG